DPPVKAASMEPSPERRKDNPKYPGRNPRPVKLQWSRLRRDGRTPLDVVRLAPELLASMEPSPERRKDERDARSEPWSRLASMEPSPERRKDRSSRPREGER